jgi:hypothetical protein
MEGSLRKTCMLGVLGLTRPGKPKDIRCKLDPVLLEPRRCFNESVFNKPFLATYQKKFWETPSATHITIQSIQLKTVPTGRHYDAMVSRRQQRSSRQIPSITIMLSCGQLHINFDKHAAHCHNSGKAKKANLGLERCNDGMMVVTLLQ